MRFPTYISISAQPGYNMSLLEKHSPYELFNGKVVHHVENDTTIIQWGNDTHHIKGYVIKKKQFKA